MAFLSFRSCWPLLVICAHEDDEQAYSGVIRAAVEAKIPVQVLILTAGDVGECETHYTGSLAFHDMS